MTVRLLIVAAVFSAAVALSGHERVAGAMPAPSIILSNAVVRSYSPKNGVAYLHLTYPEYRMPLIQIWRFDGKVWSDNVDPGIFVR